MRPVIHTQAAMKHLKKLPLTYINATVLHKVDPFQWADCSSRVVDYVVALALPSISCVRLLFLNCSSAFNTIRPLKLTAQRASLGALPTMHNCILDFLTNRPWVVRMDTKVSTELTVSTGTPPGVFLSPKLDTTILVVITGGAESASRDLVLRITIYEEDNNLVLKRRTKQKTRTQATKWVTTGL